MADVEQPGEDTANVPVGFVGDGPVPPSLMRFNWGVFYLPVVWAVFYGIWPIVGLWLAAELLPVLLVILVGVTAADGSLSVPALVGITVLSDAFLGFMRIWAAASANRLYWERESRRMAANPAAKPKFTCARFSARQRVWTVWGVIGLAAGMALTAYTNYTQLRQYGLQWPFIAESVVFVAAEIALGVWFADRMRSEFPELEDAARQSLAASAETDAEAELESRADDEPSPPER